MLHAECIAVGSEHGDLGVVAVSEGLQSFIHLLAVVETRGHSMDGKEGRADEFGGGPFGALAVGEVRFDMAIAWCC